MKRTCVYNRNSGACFAEMLGLPMKTEIFNRFNVLYGFVNGVYSLVSRSMSRLAFGFEINHHKTFFCHGGLQTGGFAYDSRVYARKTVQGEFYSAFSRHFLLARSGKNEIIIAFFITHGNVCLKKRDKTSAVIVGTETVKIPVFNNRGERVVIPALRHLNRIDVGIEKECGLVVREIAANRKDIVTHSLHVHSFFPDEIGNFVGCCGFFTAERRNGNQFFQQRDGFVGCSIHNACL